MAAGGGKVDLSEGFKKFADKGNWQEISSKAMTRWFKDCGCLKKGCTSNSLDIAFSGAKTKGKP